MDSRKDALPRLRGMSLKDLTAWMHRAGQPAWRAKQVFQWVYAKGAQSFGEMTDQPKDLRARMAEEMQMGGMQALEVVGNADATRRIVHRTDDGEFVESVLMLAESADDEDTTGSTAAADRYSLCVSSQIGCALACAFCRTGYGGFRRNLRVDEIVGQVIDAQRRLGDSQRLANIVFMGMGEPMLNLESVVPALALITSPQALGVSSRRIVVSTAGIVPGIARFAQADTGAGLAVSLNATDQTTRDTIMPGVRKWPIADLMEACRRFPMGHRRRMTFEYVLLKDINDTEKDGRRLVKLTHGISCKVNLILYNPCEELSLEPTPEVDAERFRDRLLGAGVACSLRRSKGRDLQAACGQLAAHAKRRHAE